MTNNLKSSNKSPNKQTKNKKKRRKIIVIVIKSSTNLMMRKFLNNIHQRTLKKSPILDLECLILTMINKIIKAKEGLKD